MTVEFCTRFLLTFLKSKELREKQSKVKEIGMATIRKDLFKKFKAIWIEFIIIRAWDRKYIDFYSPKTYLFPFFQLFLMECNRILGSNFISIELYIITNSSECLTHFHALFHIFHNFPHFSKIVSKIYSYCDLHEIPIHWYATIPFSSTSFFALISFFPL